MRRNYYSSGDWNVTCDVCSRKIKASQSRHRWDGFIVCSDDFEVRHPQDFVRARQDKITVPYTRPIPTLIFTDDIPTPPSGVCTSNGSTAIIDYAIIDCVIIEYISPGFTPTLPCIPLIISTPTIYSIYDVTWCCGKLDVQESITINNILGII